ncbi:FmdB family zinc ribbon protein [Rhodoferax sp.]|uniref:FmdB family zinc ribbon protein n=1 Tax=Rhodoferax sp. TaxID=50421 RepID=UPI001ECD05F1|nr:FmdB family zinc ribbon protein [Rhodoferax sp.]MBT9506074.1 zinc ribbon domain-containing protein [Rhodoferax sp.]
MPIYAYKCESCGFAKDVLQKMSDAPLTDCPTCGASAFKKQVTAAGFQLKGSGWYATDFKGGASGTSAPATSPASTDSATSSTDSAKPSDSSSSKSDSAPAAAAGGCGSSCACH